MHTALRLGVKAAARIRAINPDAHLCFYGLYATLNAGPLLERGADSIIGGEHDEPLLRLVRALDGAAGAAPAVPGVRTRDQPADPWIRRIPFTTPRRAHLPPLEKYARLDDGAAVRLAGQVETSRGCRHSCRHCPIPAVYGGRFFVVPRHLVLADIRSQVAAGATHITFGDPDFLNGPGHALAIAREMHAEFPALTFDFTAKIEHLLRHRARLPELRRLGCLFVVSAVESLSGRVLSILGKGHTRADVEAVLGLLRRAGIALRPSLVPFTPWATLQDYRDLLRFFDREDLVGHVDPIQFAIRLLMPPGSLLLEHPEMRPHLGRLDPEAFTWTWTHPDPRMDRLHAEVSAQVERATLAEQDPRLTFEAICARAAHAAGEPPAIAPLAFIAPPPPRDKGRPPRLTEPWFC